MGGTHKVDAVKTFAHSSGIELAHSYAYSNGGADAPLLSVVGNRRDWRVLRFRSRGAPGPYCIARTLLGVFGFCVAAAASMVCSLGQDRRTALDRTYVWISTAVLRGAGLRVRVTGSAHLRASRPAVFVLNHQSQIDPFVVGYALRTPVAPVAAKKVKHYPIVGPVARFIGTTFIDQSSPGQG